MLEFEPGWYFYVGSAFGPGGIAARCRRHLRKEKKRHWHIDVLTGEADIKEIIFLIGSREAEARWAKMLLDDACFSVPHPGFGASDAKAVSHLFYSATHIIPKLPGKSLSYSPGEPV